VVAAVHDLVDVAQGDMREIDAEVGEKADLLQGPAAAFAMGEDRDPGPAVRLGRRFEDSSIAGGGATFAPGDLQHTGAMGRPADDRPDVVVGIDPIGHVQDEQLRQLGHRDPRAPVGGPVVAVVVEAGRGDHVDAGSSCEIGELLDAPPRVAGHRIHDRPESERDGFGHLGRHRLDVAEVELGDHLDGPPAIDHEVLVGVGDPELRGIDVA
jgi:hypothetical protein